MYQLARNAAADHFRKWKNESPLDETFDPPAPDPVPDDILAHDEKTELLIRALAGFSHEKREVLVLSRYQELKYEEIGAILNADIRLKTFNGSVYTDFDVTSVPRVDRTVEVRNGTRRVYRRGEYQTVRVGKGGPEFSFDTLNGSIYVLRKD